MIRRPLISTRYGGSGTAQGVIAGTSSGTQANRRYHIAYGILTGSMRKSARAARRRVEPDLRIHSVDGRAGMIRDMTQVAGNSVEPGRSDARRNRSRILDSARKVFASEGMSAQMQTIANEAGVGLGTVYRHFPTKEELAAEIIKESLDRMANQVQTARRNGKDPWQRLDAALRANLSELASDAGARAAMAGSLSVYVGRCQDAWGRYRDELAALLADAHRHGSVRTDFLVDDLGMAMCGMSAAMDSLSYVGWERQLAVLLRGIREK